MIQSNLFLIFSFYGLKLHWSKLTHIARCYSIEDNVHIMIGIVCVCVGGEEQSESHLEEVHYSSSDILLQWPGKTAEGSTSWTLPVLKQRFSLIAVTWLPLLLQVDCSDHDSDGSHDLIGSFTTKVSEFQKAGHGSLVSSLRKTVCHASCDCGLVSGSLNCLILCSPGAVWVHPSWETEKKEELQELWCCVREELQGREHITQNSLLVESNLLYWLQMRRT